MDTDKTKNPPTLSDDALMLLALRWLADDPDCHLDLSFALDAAVTAVELAINGGDARQVCEDLTGWCADEDDVELIKRAALYLRTELAPEAADLGPSDRE